MEPSGWVIFTISNAGVIALVVFCFYKVFSLPQEHMASTLDIDTKDWGDDDGNNGENGNVDDTDKPVSGPANPQSL